MISVFVQGPAESTVRTRTAGDIAPVLELPAVLIILQLVVTGIELAAQPRTSPAAALIPG